MNLKFQKYGVWLSDRRLCINIIFLTGLLLTGESSAQGLRTLRKDTGMVVAESRDVLFYRTTPKSQSGKYERSNYIHPLYTMKGNALTEDFPEDHPYHRGIFWTWHQVWVGKERVADGWMCDRLSWQTAGTSILKTTNATGFESRVKWRSSVKGKSTVIAKESVQIEVHKTEAGYRIIDVDFTIIPLVDSLRLGGSEDVKGYGGFCLRLKLPKDIAFFSEGAQVQAQETAVPAGPWIDFQGSFDGDAMPVSGIAVFPHPRNPEGGSLKYILRKSGSMQNIPFPGSVASLVPKQGWHFNYRLIVHDKLTFEQLDALYQKFIRSSVP